MFKTQEQILNRMKESEHKAFCPSDFLDIDNPRMVSKSLELLVNQGYILRARRGIYYKELEEDYDVLEIALAIGRSNNWIVCPCGSFALYLVGLHDENLPSISFVSTGQYGFYEIGDTIIEFKHASSRYLPNISINLLIAIQVLKELGKENINNKVILAIRNFLSDSDKNIILKGNICIVSWIYKTLCEICENK